MQQREGTAYTSGAQQPNSDQQQGKMIGRTSISPEPEDDAPVVWCANLPPRVDEAVRDPVPQDEARVENAEEEAELDDVAESAFQHPYDESVIEHNKPNLLCRAFCCCCIGSSKTAYESSDTQPLLYDESDDNQDSFHHEEESDIDDYL